MSRTPCSTIPNTTTPPIIDRARHTIGYKARTRRSNTTKYSKLEVVNITSNRRTVLSLVSNQ